MLDQVCSFASLLIAWLYKCSDSSYIWRMDSPEAIIVWLNSFVGSSCFLHLTCVDNTLCVKIWTLHGKACEMEGICSTFQNSVCVLIWSTCCGQPLSQVVSSFWSTFCLLRTSQFQSQVQWREWWLEQWLDLNGHQASVRWETLQHMWSRNWVCGSKSRIFCLGYKIVRFFSAFCWNKVRHSHSVIL